MKHSLWLAHVIHHETHRTVATTLILNKMSGTDSMSLVY